MSNEQQYLHEQLQFLYESYMKQAQPIHDRLAQLESMRPRVVYIPPYEPDDGALTDDQIRSFRNASTATNIPGDRFTESLFQSKLNEEIK
jgi:hypothetical protein